MNHELVKSGLGVLVGGAFSWVIWFGAEPLPDGPLGEVVAGTDVSALGRALTGQHLLSLEVLALTLFLVLVGGGVLARPDNDGPEEGTEPL